MISFPVSVLPTNANVRTRESEHSVSPIAFPDPETILMTPGGKCSATTFKQVMIVKGQFVAGFTTTALPAKTAGMTLLNVNIIGEFHGVIIAVTPLALLRIWTF
jgi:hypothetical protein